MDFIFAQRYVVVNIPAAFVEAVANGKVERRYRVIVGKIDKPSPTLVSLYHRDRSQSDLDRAAVDHQDRDREPHAPGPELSQSHAYAAPRRSRRRDRSVERRLVDGALAELHGQTRCGQLECARQSDHAVEDAGDAGAGAKVTRDDPQVRRLDRRGAAVHIQMPNPFGHVIAAEHFRGNVPQ